VFAELGYGLGLADLREPTRTLKATTAAGVESLPLVGDISDEATVGKFAQAVQQKWGRVDVLVNNAGISFIQNAEQICAADFRRVLEVNLVAPFLLAKAFGAAMLAQGSGSIVNVASIA
jgi:NAD(P)-dependent dehydrogenase (short-subunit alcohol dehydrogenase family)